MKKVLSIAMLFLIASALTAEAQMPTKLSTNSPAMSRQADPSQLNMIRNAEAHRRQTYNDKSKPHLKPTDLNKLQQQTTQSYRPNQNRQVEPKIRQGVSIRRQSDNSHKAYLRKVKKAQEAKSKAEMVLAELPSKQQREMAKIQEKINESMTKGDQELCQKLEHTKAELAKTHARQKEIALENLERAIQNYNMAEQDLEQARMRFGADQK